MRWSWLVVLCACGDNVIPRLVAKTYEVGDVTYTQRGEFHDTLRDEDCEPHAWADGATYCTPRFDDPVYADSACTDAVAPATTHYVATYLTLGAVPMLRRLHTVTASTRDIPAYYVPTPSGCSGPYPTPANRQWGALADELDESAFDRLLRSAPEGDGRLQTIAWHTADGLYQPFGFHDRQLGDCEVRYTTGEERDHVVCRPAAAVIEYYADAACTQPLVAAASDPPAVVALGCETFASVGSEQFGPVYDGFSGCVPSTLPDGWRQFAVGAPISVPVLSRVRAGSGRIQSITLVSGNVRVPDLYLHDTTLDADCVPAPSTDIPRCMPSYTNIDTYYRDDQCSQAVQIASVNIGGCAAPARFATAPDGYHRIGAVENAPLYVPSTGDRCMQQAPPGEPHDVGPALPADTFVPAL